MKGPDVNTLSSIRFKPSCCSFKLSCCSFKPSCCSFKPSCRSSKPSYRSCLSVPTRSPTPPATQPNLQRRLPDFRGTGARSLVLQEACLVVHVELWLRYRCRGRRRVRDSLAGLGRCAVLLRVWFLRLFYLFCSWRRVLHLAGMFKHEACRKGSGGPLVQGLKPI